MESTNSSPRLARCVLLRTHDNITTGVWHFCGIFVKTKTYGRTIASEWFTLTCARAFIPSDAARARFFRDPCTRLLSHGGKIASFFFAPRPAAAENRERSWHSSPRRRTHEHSKWIVISWLFRASYTRQTKWPRGARFLLFPCCYETRKFLQNRSLHNIYIIQKFAPAVIMCGPR